ncbi:MAG: hypothetical protein CVV56_02050 [Tenericutes bacterium HGW-Tenericutes-1]|nr:MAG: hypothetical protein CVV56_02050 [Tenericutes bacterium HGW-Tenericutes-1]
MKPEKNKVKNIFDEYSVDVIPEGKENEYFTKEQSAEISKKVKDLVQYSIFLFIIVIVYLVISIFQRYYEFPTWLESLILGIVIFGLVYSVIMGVIKVRKFLKYMKDITKD